MTPLLANTFYIGGGVGVLVVVIAVVLLAHR